MPWAPDYATLDEARHYLRITDAADTVDDPEIQTAITAASRAIDRAASRQFGHTDAPQARLATALYDRHRSAWIIPIPDLYDTAGLEIHADPSGEGAFDTEITAYALEPANAVAEGQVWTQVRVLRSSAGLMTDADDAVRVAADAFGWPEIPAAVHQACLLQVARLFKRRDAPFGVAGSPEMGSELRLLARLDPDVEVSIGPYKRQWGAV